MSINPFLTSNNNLTRNNNLFTNFNTNNQNSYTPSLSTSNINNPFKVNNNINNNQSPFSAVNNNNSNNSNDIFSRIQASILNNNNTNNNQSLNPFLNNKNYITTTSNIFNSNNNNSYLSNFFNNQNNQYYSFNYEGISLNFPFCKTFGKSPPSSFSNGNIAMIKQFEEKNNKIRGVNYDYSRMDTIVSDNRFKDYSYEELRINDYKNRNIQFFNSWKEEIKNTNDLFNYSFSNNSALNSINNPFNQNRNGSTFPFNNNNNNTQMNGGFLNNNN